ncbi:MAG TPA: LssY C-terminal domain-containing protein [Dongiaceae bacterium]|nr:LssY C-terminal domain-containing protein [Dongiaceae bacterium]
MYRFILLLSSLGLVLPTAAQTPPAPRENTFQISSSTAWTDTGLTFQPGDKVTISVDRVSTPNADTTSAKCDPAGLSKSGDATALPMPDAGPGALIAKLDANAPPMLVGARAELHIDKASHLFLGTNTGSTSCQGVFEVRVQTSPGTANAANTGAAEQKSRGTQLKSQLENAAQVFMSGQFGMNNSGSHPENAASATGNSAEPAPTLHVSNATLDPDLKKELDTIPRRVNDQFNNLGDMVNFVIVGSQKDVQDALAAADWHIADTSNTNAVVNAVMQTYDSKDYLAMPMSILYLFGRKQDFGYEMAEPIAMVASRHHFRIWKAPFTWKGQEVWVGAGTHDIGFAKDKRNNSVTHKIDPAVDGERDNIGVSLQKSNKAKMFSYYLPPNPVQEARNATGDSYHSDGRLLVVFLQ